MVKIVIIAWRNWSAGRRYRSLILNAKRLGHSVWGFAANHLGDDKLTLAAFQELGVEAYPENQFLGQIGGINPDVVFGEYNHKSVALEYSAQGWVTARGKTGFFINHHPYEHRMANGYEPTFAGAHYLVSSQGQLDWGQLQRPINLGWPDGRIHVLGVPDLDVIAEIDKIDIPAIKARLGAAPGQPLIAVFPDAGSIVGNFMDLARQQGWKVAIHLHPQQRQAQNAPVGQGFYFTEDSGGIWQSVRDLGATFVTGYAPGTTGGIPFIPCKAHELIVAADCIVVWNSPDVIFEAYALGKGHCAHNSDPRLYFGAAHGLVDFDFLEQDIQAQVQQTLNKGSNDIEQDPVRIEQYYYKLDGLWWQRALDLAHRLSGVT